MAQMFARAHGVALLVVASLMTGCGHDPSERIGPHSEAGEKGSIDWLAATLPHDERMRFLVAIDELGADYFGFWTDPAKSITNPELEPGEWRRRHDEAKIAFFSSIEGKTAAQIIRMAEPAVSRRIKRELPELRDLVAREAAAQLTNEDRERLETLRGLYSTYSTP